ncbi:hypothetical protein Smp_167360 [Schistosoma mansoni]|uniref:hypothetical protein n=1 Tax=Schistosoma mansoni TaxID=6183 RepID=UPI0001A62899|nr:hypothetical protein Smp_167360 [Schistosoma mansoni]|eukprot:XP_018645898.1 hypothetical protein Smp_167360 [Schistosoma mansoni]
MGSSFSSLNKSWGCTSFGTSGNRSNRKELSGFCHCPKNCPSSYVLPSALQTKTNSLPIDELSTSIITSPTVISTYSCTCKNSLAHHQIISDTRASNVDSSYQLCGVNSEAFVPTDSNISIRVFIPRSDFHQEQLYNSQTQCINNVEKFVDIDTIKKESIFTDPLILTDCALEQFRNLISSWSCNDLCCLYLEYEAVYELQLLWKEAIKTRLRAPTLKDDLWSLAQHGWCSNTYLIRNDSTHEAHSYLLASRLSNFDELLTSLNRGKFHRSSNKSTTDHTNMMNITSTITITNTSNTVLNNKASINSLSTSEGLVDQSSDFQSEKCPDLLSSSRLKLQDTSYKMNTETHQQLHHHNWRKLPGVSILDPNSLKINTHDVSNSSEMFLTNFLCQLYTGNDPQQLLSKPDLLYQPEVNDKTKNTCNTSSNLSKLYNFLKYSPQHKCLLSNDCELIFTCTPILNLTSITLPCHAVCEDLLAEALSLPSIGFENCENSSPIVSQQSKPNEDSSSPMDNQYVFKSNDNNSHVSFPYNGTSLGFVYRHAIHCLRQNFTSLVRSPSILQRLSSQQLYELLDSSLVQAPESEILAGLLCWGELQLKLKRKNTCSGVQSSNGCPNRDNEINIQPDEILDNVSIEYQSILTSIIDNPSIINCSLSGNDTSSITNTEENDLSYFNHWLLLCNSWNNVENSIKRPTNIDCTSRLPSCHLCHGTSTAATTTTNNNNANNKSVSSESFILNHNLDKMITYTQLIDLVSIVNLLNEHNLLDCIRPAHLLSPMPNELASVLLRYYCEKCQHLNAHNSSTAVILNSMNTLHNFGCCQSKDFFNSPWNSLIQLTKSSQSICSEKQFTLEKVLSNPLSNLSPAQFSEKYHWASLLLTDDNGGLSAGHKLNSTNINVDDDDDCVCCWNKQHLIENSSMIPATGASVVRKSWSDNSNVWLNYTNRVKSQLKFLHLPPRLYYPFLNEVRMLFIQKHAVHHQRLHLMNNNNNNADNFHSQSQSSECTCWEFLLSRRFDQSCNLTNFSPNTTKRIHQSSSNKYHNKSFNLNHQQPYTTDIIRDYSQDFSSECDLSFPDLAKKRFGSKSIENNDHNNVTSRFFMNKKFTICCDYKCRDFAYCLLPSSQWTSIIDYYMRLVREFMNDPISHHPCTNNKYVHHILRLRSLWKYGLPDSLESLLICRINEYMFMLQQPPPTPSTKQQVYITDCCNPMKNTNTLIIKKNNSSVSTLTITTTTTSTASSSSSISVCSCSLPVMNMTYCEHHTTQRCTFNPSDIGWKSIENTGGSTIITTTTTSITSRTSYSLSSNNLRNSSGIRNNTINKLTRNSNHHLVSLSKASQSCSICDDQNGIYSDPNHLLNYGSLFSSVNDRKWTKSKSNYHHNVYRSDDQQRCHHRQQTRRQQQSSDIFCCPPYDHKLSSEMLTTTSFSPCYRKVLFNNDDGEDEIEKKPICCPYASYSQQTLIQPSPSLSSAISLVHLKNTDGDLRVTSNHNDISSRSNHTVVTEEQYETRLMKLSTKKYDDDKNHLNNTIYLPLLLTLPCNVSDQDHYNISSSFTRKSDLSSDSTNYSSSSSSSSTSFSSPLSGASN